MKHIALIGGRAVGKSTVSKHLRKLIDLPVLSIDKLAAKGAGMKITQFVEEHSWSIFRDLEYRILQEVCQKAPCIIDCGGGIVCEQDENNKQSFSERKAKLLKDHCLVFWLTTPQKNQQKYMHKRPSLSGKRSSADELNEVMALRYPWYQKLVDHQVSTGKLGYKRAATKIAEIIQTTLPST
jgi:shikimate kinase